MEEHVGVRPIKDKGHYEYPAWCKMETALDEYQQGRTAYLAEQARNLGPQAERQLQQWNEAADALVKGVQDLAGVDVVDCLLTIRTAQQSNPGPSELLDEHVCITFGWEVMGMLFAARERFWELLDSVKDRRPSPHAKAFLERVGRCYLFGFDAECIVMCRAVLDREFKAEIEDGDVVAWWKTTKNGRKGKSPPLNLYGRIQAAHYSRRIGKDIKGTADKVRKDGNDAVHKSPSNADALPYIQKTVQVLDALDETKRGTGDTGRD